MNPIRKLAWVYAALFFGVVLLGYIPGMTNADGQLLGLFAIEPKDDLLHLASGIWAGWAAWRSTRASVVYFKLFGSVYFLDGVLGLFFGQGILDGGLLLYGPAALDLQTRILANLPHLVIGGFAIWVGFVFSRKVADRPEPADTPEPTDLPEHG